MKHKYQVGDRVIVQFDITQLENDEDGPFYLTDMVCSDKDHDEGPWTIPEAWIAGRAEIPEPTKPGTVIVVDGHSSILSDAGYWWDASITDGWLWKIVLEAGNPKVVWEPSDE